MTAPEMVEVVARTIYEHSPELDQTACPTGYCTCNQRFDTDDEVAAHQARAVLAALTEAGTVEWGGRGRVPDLAAYSHSTVKRTHVKPWS